MRVTHPRRLVAFCLGAALGLTARPAIADHPRVTVDAAVVDFGTVEQGAVVEHVFRLRNDGPVPLRIDHVKGSCACTVGIATGDAVAPGDEAWVTVRLDTARLAGRTTKTVTVYTSDVAAAVVPVTLTGEVLVDLVVTPTPVYFGRVRRGSVARRAVRVTAGRPYGAATVTAAETADPHLRAWVEPAADGQGQQVIVELNADMPLGRFNDELVLRTTSPQQPAVTVKVLGTVEGDIAVLPPQVTFGLAEGDAAEPREVTIRNRGTEPVSVTRVTVPQIVTYDLATVEQGMEYRLRLRLRDGLPAGKVEGTVEIFTTHPREGRVVVPLYAVVRPATRG